MEVVQAPSDIVPDWLQRLITTVRVDKDLTVGFGKTLSPAVILILPLIQMTGPAHVNAIKISTNGKYILLILWELLQATSAD